MKKLVIIIICLLSCIYPLDAQTKSQVISDITYTMDDFASDLSFVNERHDFAVSNIQSISHTFGSADYFMYNNIQVQSFRKWLEEYCFQVLNKEYVGHELEIIEKTVRKVDEDEKNDKRYRFDAFLTRSSNRSVNDKVKVTFIVEWKGEGKYVSILEIKGKWYEQFQQTVNISTTDNRTQIKQKSDKDSDGFMTGLFSSSYLYIILIPIVIGLLFYFVPEKKHGWLLLSLILLVSVLHLYIWLRIPDQIDKKILAQYDKYETVDSLKVARVYKNGNWGLIDYKGNILLPIEYQGVGAFSENMTWIQKGEKFGYINKKGEIKITPQYDGGSGFHNNQALVKASNDNNVIGSIIDKEGNLIHKLPYTNLGRFKNGLVEVQLNGKYGYFSYKDFREVIPTIYDRTRMEENYIKVEKNGVWGVLDITGNTVLPLDYGQIMTNGTNTFIIRDKQTKKYGMMDNLQNTIIQSKYDYMKFLNEKLIKIKSGDLYGVMDTDGKWLLQLNLKYIGEEREEMVALKGNNKKWGFMNSKGELSIPLQYDNVNSFYDGIAEVEHNNKWGFIDKKGEVVIPLMYEGVRYSSLGLIPAKLNGKWGYINHKNETVIQFQYDIATSFNFNNAQPGTAEVIKNNASGVIDSQGKTVIPCQYQRLYWRSGYYKAKQQGKWGVLSPNGKIIHDFLYDELDIQKNKVTAVKNNQNVQFNLP